MPRIRSMKPEMFQDEKLAPLPPITRLVFLGLIAMADDAGRLLDNVRVVDSFVFPVTDDSCRESLVVLANLGRIRRGVTASGQPVIQIANWSRHQRVDHPNLKAAFPELVGDAEDTVIPEGFPTDSREVPEGFAHHTNDLRSTTNDQRPTTDEQPAARRRDLSPALREALAPYLASARLPASVESTVRAALTGMHGRQYDEPTVIQAVEEMQAANVSPFSPSTFRAFCDRLLREQAKRAESTADETAAASRAEGIRHKRETPRRATDGLRPDQVPSIGELLAAQGLVPPGPAATPERELTPDEKRKAIQDAAEHEARMTRGTLEARGAA